MQNVSVHDDEGAYISDAGLKELSVVESDDSDQALETPAAHLKKAYHHAGGFRDQMIVAHSKFLCEILVSKEGMQNFICPFSFNSIQLFKMISILCSVVLSQPEVLAGVNAENLKLPPCLINGCFDHHLLVCEL